MKIVNIIAFVIFLVAIVAVGYALLYLDNNSSKTYDLFVNVGTELIGIAVTYFLIDFFVRRTGEKHREERQRIAFKSIKTIQDKHFIFLFEVFKASCNIKPEDFVFNWNSCNSIIVKESIRYFDITIDYDKSLKVNWRDKFREEFEILRTELGKLIDKYSIGFDENQLEDIENLRSTIFDILERIDATYINSGIFTTNEGFIILDRYFNCLDSIYVNINNLDVNLMPIFTEELWSNDINPKIGSARLIIN